MLAYKFSTQIGTDGRIMIPEYLRFYYSEPVEVIMLFPEKKDNVNDQTSNFYHLIKKMNEIDESDIDVNEIYENRKQNHERQFSFD